MTIPFPDMSTTKINTVLEADCLEAMDRIDRESVDLAYLDPPFNTGRVLSTSSSQYDDRWADIDTYLAFLRPRLQAVYHALQSNGVLLVHCDWRTCHHLRFCLDEIMGAENFVNHLIWQYGLGGSSSRRFARKHDDILFYTKGPEYYFDPPMVPATSQRMKGQMKKATDVLDIPAINNMAAERVDYPTQKPLALLRLLIQACAPPDGLVLDPFCGSGTTLVAADELDRQFVGIDANPAAVRIANQRLGNERPDAVDSATAHV